MWSRFKPSKRNWPCTFTNNSRSIRTVSLREVRQAGITISATQLYEQLESLQEVVLLNPSLRRTPKPVTKLTQTTPIQEQLYVTLKLERYTTG